MANVKFKRIANSSTINDYPVDDGSFWVTGDGKSYIDYGQNRVPTNGTLDNQMSDTSRNGVENKVIKEYVDDYVDEKVLSVYSSTETEIGKWINNKPIYRKVLTFTTGNSAGNISVPIDVDNIEMFTNITGFTYNSSNGEQRILPNVYYDMNGIYTIGVYLVRRNSISITYGSSRTNLSGYLIVEYTKLTD